MTGPATHRIVVHRHALADLDAAFNYAAHHAPETALLWLTRFHERLASLSTNPERFALAPESRRLRREVRQMLFGRRNGVFRVIFLIDGDTVRIVRIRRAAQRPLSSAEIDAALNDS